MKYEIGNRVRINEYAHQNWRGKTGVVVDAAATQHEGHPYTVELDNGGLLIDCPEEDLDPDAIEIPGVGKITLKARAV